MTGIYKYTVADIAYTENTNYTEHTKYTKPYIFKAKTLPKQF